MESKKLELLLSKISEEKRDAFFEELKDVKVEEYDALLDRYGIMLDEEEKEFLTTPSARTLSNNDLEGIAGGAVNCETKHCSENYPGKCDCD